MAWRNHRRAVNLKRREKRAWWFVVGEVGALKASARQKTSEAGGGQENGQGRVRRPRRTILRRKPERKAIKLPSRIA